MAYQINQQKVIGVVLEANQALQGKGFNHGETCLGLAELIGRIIVECTSTHIQAQEMVKIVHDHIIRTCQIGAQATGKSNIIVP